MKHLTFILISILITVSAVQAQDKMPDVAAMNQQIAALYQQGKFTDAIPLAEKIVSAERKSAKNSETLALALANLAQIYKERAKLIKTTFAQIPEKDRFNAVMTEREAAENAKKNYREAIDVQHSLNNDETAAVAAAKTELAWVVYNFVISDSIRESRSQIDEAEKLYTEALATYDKLASPPTDFLLHTIQDFADFYMKYVNFEKAIPLYERYLAVAESKYGSKSPHLIPGLRAFVTIYSITDRDSEANDALQRIVAITGKPETLDVKYPILTTRSRGIAKVKADGFVEINLTDLDRSFSDPRKVLNQVVPPNQYKTKSLEVDVVVNENGDVISAKATSISKYEKQIEEAAMASKFRPFVYNGSAQKIRGKVLFSYHEF